MNSLIRNAFRTCPTCFANFVPTMKTPNMKVMLGENVRNYIFCSQNCFDSKVNQLKTKPQDDGVGILSCSFEFIQKTNEFPPSWNVILKPVVLIHAEML